jgi:hypothetical protein
MDFLNRFFGTKKGHEEEEDRLHEKTLRDLGMSEPLIPIEMEDFRNRRITARANAVKDSLENLRRQQQSQGVNLRPDISAALSRMEEYMDAAKWAVVSGDRGASSRNRNLAEQEIDKLEKLLGR